VNEFKKKQSKFQYLKIPGMEAAWKVPEAVGMSLLSDLSF